ncbi:MAG TPA: GNAT family N-acetyltransferase [Polaromonas sp.]|uniref:GNAT family N-acetyltransferase n=1 Tax=Polaromonas sp. TaxID=1869339 RepID=UPI002D281DE2|nr:GNAT family N-acetyltransferase [Polaromonas sp.]HYW58257.1 GNAT family N-acetyltransferase [Polaromonas sp.]
MINTNKPNFTLRDAIPADLEPMRTIYNLAVLNTTASYDYEARTEQAQIDWLAAKHAAGFPVLVAEQAGRVIGYASYGSFRAWAGYQFTAEHSVYVDENCRRQGVASALLTRLLELATAQKLHLLVAAIDASNAGSIELHLRLGFESAGILREAGYKFGRWLDVAFMTRRL